MIYGTIKTPSKKDGSPINGIKYWGITPRFQMIFARDKSDKKKVYPISVDNTRKKVSSQPTPNSDKMVSTNWFLENFSESKLVKSKRVYKYGFNGEVLINEETGMIDRVNFTIKENKLY